MKNKIEDLRDHLFETLERLKDEENPMEIERAQAIANVAGVIVNSAKVEVDFMRVTGAVGGSDFIPAEPRKGLPGASSSGLNGRKHPALGRSESDH